MGLLHFLAKKPAPAQPYHNEALNKIYALLFCDDLALFGQENQTPVYPWTVLLAPAPEPEALRAVATDPALEARPRLLACNALLARGLAPGFHEILGVVVEVGLPGGLDVLAAFREGGARYLNQAEKLLVWETQTAESRQLLDQLFAASLTVVNQIGRWDQPRRPFPARGLVRLTFLMSDGLYFGEGPFEVLAADPMGGPVIEAATQLMSYLTQYEPAEDVSPGEE